MPNRQRNLGINIRVTPAEKKKIERNARKCRLTVSEYLRQIAMKVEPKELPSEEIMRSILRLQPIITSFEKIAEAASNEDSRRYYSTCAENIRRVMTETLQLMTQNGSGSEEQSDGNY